MASGELPTNVIAAANRFPLGKPEAIAEAASRSRHPAGRQLGRAGVTAATRNLPLRALEKPASVTQERTPLHGVEAVLRDVIAESLGKLNEQDLVKVMKFMKAEGLDG